VQTRLLLLLLILASSAASQETAIWRSWQGEKKLIVVTTPNWDSVQGTLTRYERRDRRWIKVSEPIPVVVGHAGLAWDPALIRQSPGRYRRSINPDSSNPGSSNPDSSNPGPIKHEGDGRSPAGVFQLKGEAFGFASQLPGSRLYIPLTPTIECVDDPDSRYYGKIVDRAKVDQVDWKSSEKMSSIPQYRWGVVVNYNTDHPVRGDGSCIFLHQWSGPASGTAGCTAMSPQDIEALVHWAEPAAASEPPAVAGGALQGSNDEARTVLVQLPRSEYQRLHVHWQLPALSQ
jgi:D-alanyl-D-alanine dipeptidase